eukprot:TRINITY_DN469_c0_g2_i4.p1 TRINITY_DN469_c0_g2~~TRINITY_DN469_c0_g2_i4.p1  ORF type:complete len:716 (-),score=86.72 TRINITY_DN469_c0_g2_i4:35-2182(-)
MALVQEHAAGSLIAPFLGPAGNTYTSESVAEAVARLKGQLPDKVVVCILGSTSFSEPVHETLVSRLAIRLGGLPFTLITGGMPGVQATFANSFEYAQKLWHVRPFGHPSGFKNGRDLFGGTNESEKNAIIGEIGDVYITVEGGPGVAFEANTAYNRGALVLPLIRTGGASSGMFNFPAEALKCPHFVHVKDQRQWDLITRQDVPIDETVSAILFLVDVCAKNTVMVQPYLWLPKWVVSSDVQEFAEDWNRKSSQHEALPLGIVCGRGIWWAVAANVIVWSGYVGFVEVAYTTCMCSSSGGLAKYDTRLWLAFIIFFITLFFFEIKALGYVIYSQVQATGPFSFMGIRLRFRQWFAMMVAMSFVAHMDICSNSFFLATALYSQSCSNADVREIWQTVIDQSMLRHIDGLFGIDLTIPNLALVVWLFAFLQPLHALGLGMPLCEPQTIWPPMLCCQIQYEPSAHEEGKPPPRNAYRTCLSLRQNHGNALMATAEVARMTSVTYQDEAFAMSRFQSALNSLDVEILRTGEAPTEQSVRCLQHAMGLLQRCLFRFFIQGVLEMSLMLNLQISLLGIQRCTNGITRMRSPDEIGFFNTMGSLNWQIMLSILLSIFMAIRRFTDIHSLFTKAWTILKDSITRQPSFTSRLLVAAFCVDTTDDETVMAQIKRIRRAILLNGALAFLYMLTVWYAVMKFWAVFYCPSSLWNVAAYPPDGCVKF